MHIIIEMSRIPALGHIFDIGMLYVANSGAVVPGCGIIDPRTESAPITTPTPFVITEEGVHSRLKATGCSGLLALRVLTGCQDVRGAATYVHHPHHENTVRVALSYQLQAKFSRLNNDISDFIPPQYGTNEGTHLITGILYGAKFIFLFEKTLYKVSNKLEEQIKLKRLVESLSTDATYDDNDLSDLRIVMFGDVDLGSQPRTYEQASDLVRNLQSKVKQVTKKCIPVEIDIQPLKLRQPDVTISQPEVSNETIRIVCKVISNVEASMRNYHVLLLDNSNRLKLYPYTKQRVISGQQECEAFLGQFKQTLANIILSKSPDKIIQHVKLSERFYSDHLAIADNNLQGQVNILDELSCMLPVDNITSCASEQDLTQLVQTCDDDITVAVLTLQLQSDRQSMDEQLKTYIANGLNNDANQTAEPAKPWHTEAGVIKRIKSKIREFQLLIDSVYDRNEVKFVITDFNQNRDPPALIQVYKCGEMVADRFSPIPVPTQMKFAPQEDGDLRLTWSQADFSGRQEARFILSWGESEHISTSDLGHTFRTFRGNLPTSVTLNCVSGVWKSRDVVAPVPLHAVPPSMVTHLRVDESGTHPVIRWGEPHENTSTDAIYVVKWFTGGGLKAEHSCVMTRGHEAEVPAGVKITCMSVRACNPIKGEDKHLSDLGLKYLHHKPSCASFLPTSPPQPSSYLPSPGEQGTLRPPPPPAPPGCVPSPAPPPPPPPGVQTAQTTVNSVNKISAKNELHASPSVPRDAAMDMMEQIRRGVKLKQIGDRMSPEKTSESLKLCFDSVFSLEDSTTKKQSLV